MKTAILFSGQGTQYVGMGKDLYEHDEESRSRFDEASNVLDWDIKEVCFEDTKGLIDQTRYTQAALFVTNYAIYEAFKKYQLPVEATLGFSLGEYDALVASGALDFKTGLKIVDKRAELMESCAKEVEGGMYAVIGMERSKLKEVIESVSKALNQTLSLANDNCEGQVTIAGTIEALKAAADLLKMQGAKRVVPLNVSGAFHSALMERAALELRSYIEPFEMLEPKLPVVSNVTSKFMGGQEIKENIPLQITHGVRFRESILYLHALGIDTFIELGPKPVLSRLVTKILKGVAAYHIYDTASLHNIMSKVGEKNA